MEHSTDLQTTDTPEASAPEYGRFGRFIRGRKFGLLMALLALAAVLYYVFICTPYQDFLFSDMKSFWTRAMDRLAGKEFLESQFLAWPPLYHIFLAEVFRVLRWLGLENWIRLETALAINIVAFAASVYAFQRLAVHWFTRPSLVLISVLLYAFGFPALYFNAFLLSDNLGAALLVMAVSVAVCRKGWWAVVLAALLFGAATIIRPSQGPYGLAFIFLYLGQFRFNWQFFARSAVFTVLFFASVFAASSEVSRISHGKVTGLSANGGLDFFISNADYHRVELNYDGWNLFIIVPSLSWQPEKGTFNTNVPFYNQSYYFKLGLEAIEHSPSQIWKNIENVSDLFFSDMLPTRFDAPGFGVLRPIWDWLKFGMFATLGLYCWMWRGVGTRTPSFLLLISTIIITLIVSYIFTGEPRYTYSIIFVFYLLFFKLVELLRDDWRRWRKAVAIYAGVLLLVSAATYAVISYRPDAVPTVALQLKPPEYPNNGDAASALPTQPIYVGSLRFPYVRRQIFLSHPDDKHLRLDQPATLNISTRMEVLGKQPLALFFGSYSTWPFHLFIDGRPFLENDTPDYFLNNEGQIELTPGVHDIKLTAAFIPREGGLAMNYAYYDKDWRVRQAIGLDTDRVHFLPIATGTPKQ